jgi:hypothetical protein
MGSIPKGCGLFSRLGQNLARAPSAVAVHDIDVAIKV